MQALFDQNCDLWQSAYLSGFQLLYDLGFESIQSLLELHFAQIGLGGGHPLTLFHPPVQYLAMGGIEGDFGHMATELGIL